MTENTIHPDNLVSRDTAERFTRRYVCGKCWNDLQTYQIKGDLVHLHVTCELCGDGSGFVSRRYAERRQQESLTEYVEAKALLTPAVPWMRQAARKTEKEILSSLGF